MRRSNAGTLLLAAGCVSAAAALAAAAQPPEGGPPGDPRFAGLPAAEARLREAARAAKVPWPLRDVAIRVEKRERRLVLLSAGTPLRTFRIALGFAPEGHKEREGDGRTPEGEYYICTRNGKSRYHLFLGISYPAPRDAERGLAAGLIDAKTAARVRAVRKPQCPPWNTPLGGAVGLHGHGAERDWTLGCIALENPDVDELWVACPLGTPVSILP